MVTKRSIQENTLGKWMVQYITANLYLSGENRVKEKAITLSLLILPYGMTMLVNDPAQQTWKLYYQTIQLCMKSKEQHYSHIISANDYILTVNPTATISTMGCHSVSLRLLVKTLC